MTTYRPQDWQDGSPATPLSAARLAHLEAGVFGTSTGPGRGTGVLIPLYIYPASAYSNADYNGLIALARAYRHVPVIAVINNSNGPGASQDGNFTVAITRMRAAGITVAGYIDTSYRTVSQADVLDQIGTWLEFYPDLDGLFLDQMDNDGSSDSLAYYTGVRDYAHAQGLHPVIANPGTPLLGAYYDGGGAADILVVHENSTYPAEADLEGDYAGGNADYPWHQRAVLVYGQAALSAAQLAMIRQYAGWVYVTTDTLPNPWDALPSYLEQLLQVLGEPGGTGIDDTGAGIVLRDNAGTPHYWRVAVSSAGVLSTTDLGTTRPAG